MIIQYILPTYLYTVTGQHFLMLFAPSYFW